MKQRSIANRQCSQYPFRENEWGRGRELNPGARLHRPIGYQATSPRPQFDGLDHFLQDNAYLTVVLCQIVDFRFMVNETSCTFGALKPLNRPSAEAGLGQETHKQESPNTYGTGSLKTLILLSSEDFAERLSWPFKRVYFLLNFPVSEVALRVSS